MKSIIRNFIAKLVAGRSDDGIMITLKDPKKVDFQTAMLEDLLMRNGIDPKAITSEQQLKNIINQIKSAEAQAVRNTDVSGIRSTESAKVFDLEGKEIPKGSKIMGGKAIDDDLPPPGSRGGADDIAAPVQSQEETLRNMTEAEIKKNIEAQNKSSIDKILQRKNREDVYDLDDYDTTNMSDIKKEIIRTETKLGNLNPDLPGFRERAKPLVDKIEALQKKLRDDKANGGRIGFRIGSDSGKDTSGRDYASDTTASRSVATSPSRDPNTMGGGNEPNNNPVLDIGKAIASNTAKTYLKNKAIEKLGLGSMLGMAPQVAAILGIINSVRNPEINEEDMQFATGGRVGLKFGTGKKFLQKVFGKEKFTEMKTRDPEMYQGMLEIVDMYRKRDKEGLKMYLQKFLPHMDDAQIEDFIRGSDGSEGLIGELIRLGSGRDYAGKIEMMKRADEMRKLDNLEVTDDMIRKPNANGGIMRLGFKDGMNRRTFLKFLAGAASIPIIGKIFKPLKVGKTVTKVPIIKTADVAGKPEWFDQLVNKVILEGDDMTKQFATKEREIVHATKIDEDTTVRVTQDMDQGAVRVEYESPENVYGDPVQMQYKKPLPDEGDPNPMAEFDTAESGPVGRADGPDDYSIDIDEVGGTSISDLTSDVSKLKAYATGQKPTLKEIVQIKKRKDRAKAISEGGENEMDEVIRRQGEFIENDLVDLDPGDFASGGIARMLGE
jgi:hypothetical protein